MLLSYREGLTQPGRPVARVPRPPLAAGSRTSARPELEPAREAIDDPEPYVPGSFDDVLLAYDLGWLTDADYDVLAVAADGLPGS